jgi:hypothetical protein
MIQLTKSELIESPGADCLIAQFEQMHLVRLRQLLSSDLTAIVSSRMDRDNWIPREHRKIGRELALEDPLALNVLRFAANTPKFLGLVERVVQPDRLFHGAHLSDGARHRSLRFVAYGCR